MIKSILKAVFLERIVTTPVEGPVMPPGKFDPEWLIEEHGLVHLDFGKVLESISLDGSEDEGRKLLWDIILEWLYQLSLCLETDYRIVRTKDFAILAPAGEEAALANYCQSTKIGIKKSLSNVVTDDLWFPVAVIGFESTEPYYYSYHSYFSDGIDEIAESGGAFIGPPFNDHIVFQHSFAGEYGSYRSTIAHELSHSLMAHLKLPMWLDEGITQNIEEDFAGAPSMEPIDLRELVTGNREYWAPENIQNLWTGLAFMLPESQKYAYYFAKVLVNLIRDELCHSKEEFVSFVINASIEDGGEAAFHEVFGQSLGVLVEEILGQSAVEWKPLPETWQVWDSEEDGPDSSAN